MYYEAFKLIINTSISSFYFLFSFSGTLDLNCMCTTLTKWSSFMSSMYNAMYIHQYIALLILNWYKVVEEILLCISLMYDVRCNPVSSETLLQHLTLELIIKTTNMDKNTWTSDNYKRFIFWQRSASGEDMFIMALLRSRGNAELVLCINQTSSLSLIY